MTRKRKHLCLTAIPRSLWQTAVISSLLQHYSGDQHPLLEKTHFLQFSEEKLLVSKLRIGNKKNKIFAWFSSCTCNAVTEKDCNPSQIHSHLISSGSVNKLDKSACSKSHWKVSHCSLKRVWVRLHSPSLLPAVMPFLVLVLFHDSKWFVTQQKSIIFFCWLVF